MNSHDVLTVMTFVDESSSTWVAIVAVLPCVELHVLIQTFWRREIFPTYGTLDVIVRLLWEPICSLQIVNNTRNLLTMDEIYCLLPFK